MASCVAVSAAPTGKPSAPAVKAGSAASNAASKKAEAAKRAHAAMLLLAPADEYFGPLKQSFLGIRNTIKDLGLRYDVNHDIGPQTLASANLTERAIVDWEKKYPRDHGIPVQVFSLQRLYSKIATVEGRAKAQATAKWLIGRYPSSPQARQMRTLLATEVLPPLTTPAPAVTPTPAYGSAFGDRYPSQFVPPPATPTPSTAVTPLASPTPNH